MPTITKPYSTSTGCLRRPVSRCEASAVSASGGRKQTELFTAQGTSLKQLLRLSGVHVAPLAEAEQGYYDQLEQAALAA